MQNGTPNTTAIPFFMQPPPESKKVDNKLNLYVRGIDPSSTDDSFRQLCSPYGNISSAKAIVDHATGICKGYGFVMYETSKDAYNALFNLRQDGFQDVYDVHKKSFGTDLEPTNTVYISNLSLQTTEDDLLKHLASHPIESVRILTDNAGQSRCIGFARLPDIESAQKCIEDFSGKELKGRKVFMRFAENPARYRERKFSSSYHYQAAMYAFMQQFYFGKGNEGIEPVTAEEIKKE